MLKNNSKWKYIKELLNRYPDISFNDKDKIINKLYLPYAYLYWKIKFPFSFSSEYGKNHGNANDDKDKYLTYEELIEIYSPYFKLPYVENKENLIDIQIKKEGKSDVGKESQIDINKTLENKIKRLIIEKDIEELFNENNLIKYLTEEPFDDRDLVFNTFRTSLITKNIKHVILAIDVSGSINDKQRLLAKSLFSLIFNFLSKNEDESYISLFLHDEKAYYKGRYKINKNANIKDYIKKEQIGEFLKMQSGNYTSLIDLTDLIKRKIEKTKTTNYFIYVGDFYVSETDILYFIKNLLDNEKIHYIALICTGNTNKISREKYEIIIQKMENKSKAYNKMSFIAVEQTNKTNDNKYIAEDLINISKFISIAGYHET